VIVAKAPTTASRVIEGEAVILSMETKVLRGLNPVGSRVWELIDGQRGVGEIAARIAEEFDVDAAAAAEDVEAFVGELLSRGLVTRVG
jgi:hypothetical protein